jgi:hypothetical protein
MAMESWEGTTLAFGMTIGSREIYQENLTLNGVKLFIEQCDEVLICGIFKPLEAQKIFQTTISSNFEEDFVAWHKTKTFNFSVHRAYCTEWEAPI